MSYLGQVGLSDKVDGLYIGKVNLSIDVSNNAILYAPNGYDISGSSDFTHKSNTGVISVNEDLSYTSDYPIGIESAFNENNYTTALLAQNKDSSDGSSISILLTNDQGSDNAYYAGLTMFSSNSTPQYSQFPSMKNALSLNSQSSSIVISPWNGQQAGTAGENGNIILTYNGGSKALILTNEGRLIVGADNPSYSGDSYGGDDGGVGKVLTSNGANGLIWTPQGGYNSYWNVLYENGQQTAKGPANSIILYQKLDQYNIKPNLRMLFKCIFNFTISSNNVDMTFRLIRITNAGDQVLQSFVQSLTGTNHHSFPINFDWVMTDDYSLSFKITATCSNTYNVSTDALDYYSVIVDEIQPSP